MVTYTRINYVERYQSYYYLCCTRMRFIAEHRFKPLQSFRGFAIRFLFTNVFFVVKCPSGVRLARIYYYSRVRFLSHGDHHIVREFCFALYAHNGRYTYIQESRSRRVREHYILLMCK